ncbi:glycosyltransferase [Paenibacillus sambharensis]|uniref:glycosyltransferase n=1 Tax=Paenibacillus sambharensis TaxID=1803190 RepID=UPI0011B4ABBE|nr:glycosyltransferase [Paenibacillus sambharensis]
MANIVIVSQRLLGHVIPILGVGAELVKRGHSVRMLGHAMNKELVVEAGLQFSPIGWDKVPNLYMEYMLNDLLRALERSPDLIIADSAQCAPAYAAELLGIPWVSFQTTVPLPDEHLPGGAAANERMRQKYGEQLNAIRSKHGLPPLEHPIRTRGDFAGLSPFLHLLMVLPELAGSPEAYPPSFCLVGGSSADWRPGLPELKFHTTDRLRLVVSTSSVPRIEYREVMNRYVEAAIDVYGRERPEEAEVWICETEPYQAAEPLPAAVHWTSQHPVHHVLLPEAHAAIVHGGCGTLQQCIRFGVPMVIIPLGADHPVLAKRCEELGVAVVCPPDRIDGNELKEKVGTLLTGGYRDRAEMLARKVSRYTPNETSADGVEMVLENKCYHKDEGWIDADRNRFF